MQNKTRVVALVAALSIVGAVAVAESGLLSPSEQKSASAELMEITWEDLIPADYAQPENPLDSMTQEEIDKLMDGSEESRAKLMILEEAFSYAPVVPDLDGKRVKLPGYVTPLDFDNQMLIKEFLLVPYMGACIHTPPPPANQVVYVKSDTEVSLENPYDPVWVIGVMRADTVKSELAEAGYQLEVEKVLPYKGF